jgi:glycosyltransferase involved in cell wall biosynthesis
MEDRKMHRVGIGLPVYNGERHIAETLESLLAQTYEDFDLIISDNASIDRTEEICREYTDSDSRVRYTRNSENLGAARNYRRVFELSSCEYFRWANCDDVFAPDSLARCIEVLDQDISIVLTYPKTILINDRGEVISKYEDNLNLQNPKASVRFSQFFQRVGLVNVIYGLIRSDVLRQTGLLRNFSGGDIPLVAELSLYGKFHEIPEYLFYRRLHAEAYSSYKDDPVRAQEFFDPSVKERASLKEWKHLLANYRSVMNAPLRKSEKLHIGNFLTRSANWKRDRLFKELFGAMRKVVG